MGSQLHQHFNVGLDRRICSEEMKEKIQQAPDFNYTKTKYNELAQLLGTPMELFKNFRHELINGKLGYNQLITSLIQDWLTREGPNATILCLTKVLRTSEEWAVVADFLQTQFHSPVSHAELSYQGKMKWKTYGDISFAPKCVLGRGSFGTVYKGKWGQVHVAVKKIILESEEDEKVIPEINALLDCNGHDNIVKYYHIENVDGEAPIILLALELCDITLKKWIDRNKQGHNSNLKIPPKKILLQITRGVAFLHDKGIIHRDIKPENVLMLQLPDNKVQVKICDFGICRRMPIDRTSITLRTCSGSIGWMAPEVLVLLSNPSDKDQSKMSTATDIFSLGCLYYYVLSGGTHPFGDNLIKTQSNILEYMPQIKLDQLNVQYLGYVNLILMIKERIVPILPIVFYGPKP